VFKNDILRSIVAKYLTKVRAYTLWNLILHGNKIKNLSLLYLL